MGELSWVDSSNEWEQADLSIPGSADNHTLQIWSKRWTKRMGELGGEQWGKSHGENGDGLTGRR
jgi:hypothetical protein